MVFLFFFLVYLNATRHTIITTYSILVGGLLFVLFLIIPIYLNDSRSQKFAGALKNLSFFLSCATVDLHKYKWEELLDQGEKKMLHRVRELVKVEHQKAGAVIRSEDRKTLDELEGYIACRRQELRDTHQAFLAFGLVEEKWDSYFDKVKQELAAADK